MAEGAPIADATFGASETTGGAITGPLLGSPVAPVGAYMPSLWALLLGATASADCTVVAFEYGNTVAVPRLLLDGPVTSGSADTSRFPAVLLGADASASCVGSSGAM